jgi:hypothetical protein
MINRQQTPAKTMGIYNGMNPSFGNDLYGNMRSNSANTGLDGLNTDFMPKITYPGNASVNTLGEEAWLNFPIRVQTQSATDPLYTQTGSNLSGAQPFASALARDAGIDVDVPTGSSVGGTAAY